MGFRVTDTAKFCVCDICGAQATAEEWTAGPPNNVVRYLSSPFRWRPFLVANFQRHACPAHSPEQIHKFAMESHK